MKESFEQTYHELEKNHWWFKSRRNYIHSLLKAYPKDTSILDIGCSSGILLRELREQGFSVNKLYGVDISEEAIKNCWANGIPNAFAMDAQAIDLQEKFDVIVASDCLEHLADDRKAIKNWNGLLKPGGELWVFVPAFSFLWSAHDVANMHYRRYTRQELKEKLSHEQLQILKASYWNFSLFLPVSLVRLISRLWPGRNKNASGDLYQLPGPVNEYLSKLVFFENRLLQHLNFPFGVSTYCIAKKAEV